MPRNIKNLKLTYPDGMLFVSGDFNARINDRIDFIPEDNLFYIFGETDYVNSSFELQVNSKDGKINSFDRALIGLCCLFDIHVFNGRLHDLAGDLTFFSANGASVADYMFFYVHERYESDHLPSTCTMRFNIDIFVQPQNPKIILMLVSHFQILNGS